MLTDRDEVELRKAGMLERFPGLSTISQTIHCGGDEQSHYENNVRNLKRQVEYVGRDDPWAKPDMLPPQLVLYNINLRIINAEREMFESIMEVGGADVLRVNPGPHSASTYINYRVQAMWATWLAARIGFTRIF